LNTMSLRTVDDFPFLKDKIYFNCAAQGAVPESTTRVIERYFNDYCATIRGNPNPDAPNYSDVKANSKKLFAEIIGAKVSELAFVPNATTGINTAFSMIPFERGDNIVLSDLSYPMGASPPMIRIPAPRKAFLREKKATRVRSMMAKTTMRGEITKHLPRLSKRSRNGLCRPLPSGTGLIPRCRAIAGILPSIRLKILLWSANSSPLVLLIRCRNLPLCSSSAQVWPAWP